jgi:6-phosphofructokinase 1
MAIRKIGILTGGGDVPGLNSVIKGVVYGAAEHNAEVIGIRRGWDGLTQVDVSDPASIQSLVLPLNKENTRTIDRTGGTFLHSSRTNPAKMKKLPAHVDPASVPVVSREADGTPKAWDMTPRVLKNLEALRIDSVIAIGGDDTLSYAARLDQEGVPVIAIPKTMDNDVRNTEYCVGFSTAITRAMEAVQRQRTTVGSHERIGIFRLFGRDSGFTALYTAYVTNTRCVIPEYKVSLPKLIDILVKDKRNNPSNYSLVVLSEGAEWEGYTTVEYGEPDAYGHRKKANIGEVLAREIEMHAREETVVSDLTYDLRSGSPDFVDKMIAATFGTMALDAIFDGKHGLMTAIVDGKYELSPIPDPKLGPRQVDVANLYNKERYRPNYKSKLGLPIFLTRA